MKKNRLNLLFVLGTALLLMSSCQKDVVTYNDGYDDGLKPYGEPVIDKITSVTDAGTILENATLAEMIAIHGENLSQVTSIRFNDVEADLKEIYAVNSRIVLPVPRKFPTEVDNSLTVTTTMGTASAEFVVTVPKLVVNGLYNEFAAPGDTVQIIGNNFDLYDITVEKGTVELNGKSLPILEATATALKIVIPENTPDNSVLSISSPTVLEPIETGFRNSGYKILYYDTENGGMWSGDDFLTDGTKSGDPEPLLGIDQYSRIAGDFAAWSWNVPFGGGFNLSDADIIANPGNYYVKFEMNTNKALGIGNFIIGDYTWNPGEGGISFNTYGDWKTVTIDLAAVLTPKSGWNGYTVVFQPSADISADFSFCNLRIVKK